MMQPVLTQNPSVPALTWRWKDRHDNMHAPRDMETRHLFYTFRMIWNHCAPPKARVGRNIQFYRFSPFYTADYMKQAVQHVWRELKTRRDLTAGQERELAEMMAWVGADFTVVDEPQYLHGPRLALEPPRQ